MQLEAKKSNYKPVREKMSGLFNSLISKYAQETGATTPEGDQNLDPNTLQVGQQIYDQDGNAHTVIQNENGNVTTMPVDQAGQQIPQGVKTIQPQEVGNYSQNPPQQNVQAKIAQEELGIDWEELESMALEVATFAKMGKDKAFFDALDRLNTAALSYVQMPTDINSKDMVANTKVKSEFSSVKKKAQEVDYLKNVKDVTLEAIDSVLSDISYDALSQGPGYVETALQGFLDSLNDKFVIELVPVVENMIEQEYANFLEHFQAYLDAGEIPSELNEQKLFEYYRPSLQEPA